MNYVVYVLKSVKDGKLYIGQTNNLEDRFRRHIEGRIEATCNRRPLMKIYSENFSSRAEAMAREKYLKSLKGGIERKLNISFNK